MKNFLIIGARGQGKSTYIKKNFFSLNRKVLVNDVNNEYGFNYLDLNVFLEQATTVKNHVIIFEESTIFFNNRGFNKKITEILVRSRHTNNVCVFVFHSVRAIPIYILDLINYIVLFNTSDTLDVIEKKFNSYPEIINFFYQQKAVNKKIEKFKPKIFKLI